jgi:hypothetical protein
VGYGHLNTRKSAIGCVKIAIFDVFDYLLVKSSLMADCLRMSNTNRPMMTATFKAYQGADKDKLIQRLVDCPDWSHIGQLRAAAEMNQVEVDVFFSGHTTRANRAARNPIMGAWRLQSIK